MRCVLALPVDEKSNIYIYRERERERKIDISILKTKRVTEQTDILPAQRIEKTREILVKEKKE